MKGLVYRGCAEGARTKWVCELGMLKRSNHDTLEQHVCDCAREFSGIFSVRGIATMQAMVRKKPQYSYGRRFLNDLIHVTKS